MSQNQIIIDVREPYEYQAGHVEGAINIPPASLSAGAPSLDGIDKNAGLIVYCRTGSRSAVAIQMLKQMGFTSLTNGINAEHVIKNYLS
ncbi:MAG: rhodanese-like domain-containing protein [Candidatus Saccharimonadales bacterium]